MGRSGRRHCPFSRRAALNLPAGLDPSALIAQYGYWAIAIGTFLEGETILLMGGFAAHRGLLDIRLVMLIAGAGSFLGDQCYFWLGRRYGPQLAARWPFLNAQAPRIRPLLDRWGVALIIGIRFMVGLRTAGPFVMGWVGVNPLMFALCNALGAALWAALIGGAGYWFANALDAWLQDLGKYEDIVLIGLLCTGLAIWAWHWLRRKPRR